MKLDKTFYLEPDVVLLAKLLIGKVLYTRIDGEVKCGMITETEAYSYKERACHAYQNKRTKRTETLFATGGTSYVYLCYGIHHLFNIVTNKAGVAEAVLIRAVAPLEGFSQKELMVKNKATCGPGKLSKEMGISTKMNNLDLTGNIIWLEDNNLEVPEIVSTARIGVDYAGDDALLPWRFLANNNPWISKGLNTSANT